MYKGLRMVLASASPRRREILTRLGFQFEVHTSNVPEDDVTGRVSDMVALLSRRKAEHVALEEKDALVISCDTLVSLDGQPLGKPHSPEDARRMLLALSGRAHEVVSGLCLINTKSHKVFSCCDTTSVLFRALTPEEIDAYVASGEPMDKAGAYAIQGGAGKFVEKINGSYDNIVGFPSEKFLALLEDAVH